MAQEDRSKEPGASLWVRGDGAFSISYTPPLPEGVSEEKMFAQMRAWLDEREGKSRTNGMPAGNYGIGRGAA